ncbi:hypothetical protein ACODM8_01790 [Vibrio ostreicida]|uniref:Uncharacterized protein n=1 Tax=Vibrio ostreicida TaxID=526588 RepID=A0ABT8BY83_9VIBR|nr:hypothetical protein [Vibrio ostreicida]MDN3610003.1 hypothetical protein [Vibrio ostreicida]MDN3611050.1 hypothetical protein [Vibrio ostreicida]NPD10428.1 hypothetical protein [Vibrio ostreicida]
MDTFNEIKSVMDDLNSRRSALAEQMKEFQQLQREIQVLVDQSGHSPEARDKLERLNQAFPNGFQSAQQALMAKVLQVEENFKTLETGLKEAGSTEDEPKSEAPIQVKKRALKRYM